MKKATIILFIVGLTFCSEAQDSIKTFSPELIETTEVLNMASFDRTLWSLYANHNREEYAPTASKLVPRFIDAFLDTVPTENKRRGQIKEFNLIKKYQSELDSLFNRYIIFGSDQPAKFLHGSYPPVRFGLHNNKELSMVITGLYIDNIYNTIKLTSRQRATKILTVYLLQAIKKIPDYFKTDEIKYYGVTAIYGSKDFTSKSPIATQAEFVAMISPATVLNKFSHGEITEDELIESSDIYICDRDMPGEVKKIKVVLE